jgi:hypothetical protein
LDALREHPDRIAGRRPRARQSPPPRPTQIDEARDALECALAILERKGCLPAFNAFVSRSTRSAPRKSDHHERAAPRDQARTDR